MYQYQLHQKVNSHIQKSGFDIAGEDNLFYTRFMAGASAIHALYNKVYEKHPKKEEVFNDVLETIISGYKNRPAAFKEKDEEKQRQGYWFLSNAIAGMSLYVDRFCGNIDGLNNKLGYLKNLGINLMHLMPVFESPAGQSDGGYAVSNYRSVDSRFGSLDDSLALQQHMQGEGMYLMLDIVLNHTSNRHEWAAKAREGDAQYQDFYYMYDERTIPDQFETSMPEIFPENAPGNFTWVPECGKWVMTVFHNYQWDLNYTNPQVFAAMLDTILFYANIGVDILRIDAPAFIWKEMGTTCQNLPMAHTILQLIWQCVKVAAPGMAILGEAIVAPGDIMQYFGTGLATAQECDIAYNATQMALQWDMLATANTGVMLAAQPVLQQKPYGATWITYTRCHDDIGLGFSDSMIEQAGYTPYSHRSFLKEYYTGQHGSPAKGALFSVNPKTQDARISGSLASLCGLETALEQNNQYNIILSIKKILLMQAHPFFLGGIPMLFYGDEVGYTNDYTYLSDPGKAYDNRWMHRPLINWKKNEKAFTQGTVEQSIFSGTQQLLELRKKFVEVSDFKNIIWLSPHNIHVAGFIRYYQDKRLYFVFNFSEQPSFLTWYAFKEHGNAPYALYDHWNNANHIVGKDYEYLIIDSYSFCILEPVEALG